MLQTLDMAGGRRLTQSPRYKNGSVKCVVDPRWSSDSSLFRSPARGCASILLGGANAPGRGDVAAASPGRTEVRPSAVAAVYDRRGQLVRRGTNPSDWRRIAPPSQDRNLAAPIFSIGRQHFKFEQDASTVVKDSSTKHIQ